MKALITIGLPGCGKSTWAKAHDDSFIEINLDECRRIVSGDASDQTCTPGAVRMRDTWIVCAAMSGQDIVISDTNIDPRHRSTLVARLWALGYQVAYVCFDRVPVRVCQRRNMQRVHPVPPEAFGRMHDMLFLTHPVGCIGVDQQVRRYSPDQATNALVMGEM